MRIRALLIVAAAAAVTAGCGNGEPASPVTQVTSASSGGEAAAAGPDLSAEEFVDETGKDTVDVQARDNKFIAPYIEVSAGTEVSFRNAGQQGHDVLPAVDGAFAGIEPGEFEPGDEGTVTFVAPGDYAYYCSLHGTKTKGMTGAIRVIG